VRPASRRIDVKAARSRTHGQSFNINPAISFVSAIFV